MLADTHIGPIGRLVTSAGSFGRIVTDIEIEVDRNTRDVVSARADNLIVSTDDYAKDPEQTALISAYDEIVKPLAERPVGTVTATLSREGSATGESVLGDIIADAQLAATRSQEDGGAVIAFTNSGGIRVGVPKTGVGTVTYADLFAAQPFGNTLVTLTMTGAQIKMLLEQKWRLDQSKPRILQISKGFAYTWDAKRRSGDFVAADEITLDGRPIDPAARYRVTVNSFLAEGGDGFSVLKEGTDPHGGPLEVPAPRTILQGQQSAVTTHPNAYPSLGVRLACIRHFEEPIVRGCRQLPRGTACVKSAEKKKGGTARQIPPQARKERTSETPVVRGENKECRCLIFCIPCRLSQ